MPVLAWTYTTLFQALQDWPIASSPTYLKNLPNIIALGEQRLWGDLNIEAYDKVDDVNEVTVVGTRVTPKPADVKQLRNVAYFTPGVGQPTAPAEYVEIEKRSLDYCRAFAPVQTVQGPPQFYAELNSTSILLVPTPDAIYTMSYHYIASAPVETLVPTAPNSSTYLSRNAADALLAACLAESEHYIQADDRYTDYINKYNNELLPRLRAEFRGQIRADYSPARSSASVAQE